MYRRPHNQRTGSCGGDTGQEARGQNRFAGKGSGPGQKRKWSPPVLGNGAGPLKKAHHNHTDINGQPAQHFRDGNHGKNLKGQGPMGRGTYTAGNRNDSTQQYKPSQPTFPSRNPFQKSNKQTNKPRTLSQINNHDFRQPGRGRGHERGGYSGGNNIQNGAHTNHLINPGPYVGSQKAYNHQNNFTAYQNPQNQARATPNHGNTHLGKPNTQYGIGNQTAKGYTSNNFSNVNHFQSGANQAITHTEQQVTRHGFDQRGRGYAGFGRHSNRGSQFPTTPINPFQRPVPLEHIDVIDYDNYDADSSSGTDYNEDNIVAQKGHCLAGQPLANPLTQVFSKLDNVLLHLINNTPQYRSTLSRFMDGYTGPGDLEFWMNTVRAEHMNWEVLHEVERLKLQLPPGWKCIVREFEERRMETNIYKEKHASVTTNPHNPSEPGGGSSASVYNLRSERHGGTWAEPVTAKYQLPSQSSAEAAKEKPLASLPETHKAFIWTNPETPYSFQSTSQPAGKSQAISALPRSPKAFITNTPQTPCSFQSKIRRISLPNNPACTYRFGA